MAQSNGVTIPFVRAVGVDGSLITELAAMMSPSRLFGPLVGAGHRDETRTYEGVTIPFLGAVGVDGPAR